VRRLLGDELCLLCNELLQLGDAAVLVVRGVDPAITILVMTKSSSRSVNGYPNSFTYESRIMYQTFVCSGERSTAQYDELRMNWP